MLLSGHRIYFLHPDPRQRKSTISLRLNYFIDGVPSTIQRRFYLGKLIFEFRHALRDIVSDRLAVVSARLLSQSD